MLLWVIAIITSAGGHTSHGTPSAAGAGHTSHGTPSAAGAGHTALGTPFVTRAIVYGKYLRRESDGNLDSSPNTLYLYTPATSATATPPAPATPFVVQVHGGGFISGAPFSTLTPAIEAYLDNGIAYASLGYRLVGQTYYYHNGGNRSAALLEEEFVDVDEAGALRLATDGALLSDYAVATGNQEKITKCIFDTVCALELLLTRANELCLDVARVGFEGGSAGGAEINYLSMVLPFLNSSSGGLRHTYVPRSLAYTMAQIDYPIPMLDRGWGLWAMALGDDTPLQRVLADASQCKTLLSADHWCTRPADCNASWTAQQAGRFCSSAGFDAATLGALRDSYSWPTDTGFQRGLTKLWHTTANLAALPPTFAKGFHVLVANSRNGTNADSIIHSALWARLYATYGAQSGVQFAVYYTDYPGIRPVDQATTRFADNQAAIFNYESNFGWRESVMPAVQHEPTPGDDIEKLLLHCYAFNLSCTATPAPPVPPTPGPAPPMPLDAACKSEIAKQCGSTAGDPALCGSCVAAHARDFEKKCPRGSTEREAVAECFVSGRTPCRPAVGTACAAAWGNEAACTACVHRNGKALIAACGNDGSGGALTIEYCVSQPPVS